MRSQTNFCRVDSGALMQAEFQEELCRLSGLDA